MHALLLFFILLQIKLVRFLKNCAVKDNVQAYYLE